MKYSLSFALSFFVVLSAFIASAQEDTITKSRYHLFKPTPKNLMREMHTDRPDVTETPFTVDAGHWQLEFDFLNLYRHPISRKRSETDLLFLNGIAKVGIAQFADLEIVFSANQWHFPDKRNIQQDTVFRRRGLGDIGLRAKFNLFGNAHEKYGLAVMPSLLIPLNNKASEEVWIPGLCAIWAISLGEKWELGGQVDYYSIFDKQKTPLFNEYWATIEAGYDISSRWSVFVEYVAILSERNRYLHTANGGVIFEITPNFRLDLAFNAGLNRWSPSTIFTGFSFRL